MTKADTERAELLAAKHTLKQHQAHFDKSFGYQSRLIERLCETVEEQRLEIARLRKKARTDEAIMIGKQIKEIEDLKDGYVYG